MRPRNCNGYVVCGTGSKQINAASRIGKHLARIPHDLYIEPFLGRGNVFIRKRPVTASILNDIDCNQIAWAKYRAKRGGKIAWRAFSQARVTCGKDWKYTLKHDRRGTLFYLDPPWQGAITAYKHGSDGVKLDDILHSTRRLKGAVALSYKDSRGLRKKICKPPFRCRTIRSHVMGNNFTELLAIKR